ncbi:YybH family protein [Nonomuraea candida]|uniref:YybH family protein n=1 Tax=Nonomuraea candida TaxID=359159 RepID=UPI0009FD4DB3|nr:nuclear transport factor 2 family protein [Nonomuraea candida]
MSKISQCRALLLAAIVPALLVAGCSSGNNTQAMKGAASPGTPTDMDSMSPGDTDSSPTDTGSPTDTAGGGEAQAAVQGFFDALKSGNVDQVVNSFSDDAVAAVNGQPTAEGAQAIRALFQKQLQGANGMKQAEHTVEETRNAGSDDAIVRATSKQGDNNLRELFVLTREGEDWKISQFMNNRAS